MSGKILRGFPKENMIMEMSFEKFMDILYFIFSGMKNCLEFAFGLAWQDEKVGSELIGFCRILDAALGILGISDSNGITRSHSAFCCSSSTQRLQDFGWQPRWSVTLGQRE